MRLGELYQGAGACLARSESDLAFRAVLKVDLRVSGVEPCRKGRSGAPALQEAVQHVLDVLAGAESIDGEIRAGAIVVPQPLTPNRYPVRPLRLRVVDLELGEDCLTADIPERELLHAGVLSSQRHLPGFQRHILRLAVPGNGTSAWSNSSSLPASLYSDFTSGADC